jgi:endonuclease/exonuclease/phosphatase family metal-dependent hydrolase
VARTGGYGKRVIRVASYNVRSLYDDRDALVEIIRGMRPDVLCVQEAPRFLCWRRRRRELAHDVGMTVAAGGRVGGVSVFAGPDVRLLAGEAHRLRWFFWLEWRGLAIAVIEKDGRRLAVGSAHLDLLQGARLWHATEIVEHLKAAADRYGAVPVLAGDFNEQPADPAWQYLAARFTDCFAAAPRGDGNTFSSKDPKKRIDAVFAGSGVTVVSCGGADAAPEDFGRATDHRPVIAELDLTVG